MDIFTTLFIALGLAMDCFAVSIGIGTSPLKKTFRPVFRLSYHFGLFQAMMTFLGWLAGSSIANLIANYDHWIALILLVFVGGRMLREGFSKSDETDQTAQDPTRGASLVMLSVATSIDAMAVGLSLAMLNVNIAISSLLIGLVSSALSLTGLMIGNFLGRQFGKKMEILGGLILVGIGIRILVSHMLV
ncbi:MAG TPA: manganese efflux pump MntP family protein [Anaerolineaceae bacterium]